MVKGLLIALSKDDVLKLTTFKRKYLLISIS